MLPPPLTSPRPATTTLTTISLAATMESQATTTASNQTQQQQHHNPHNSVFSYDTAEQSKQPALAAASNASHQANASPANASHAITSNSSASSVRRLKAFLNKTLHNITTNGHPTSPSAAHSSHSSASKASVSGKVASSPRDLGANTYDDIVVGTITDSVAAGAGGFVGNITDGFGSYATAAAAADMAVTTLTNTSAYVETTTAAAFPSATQTVATFIAGNKNRATTIIVYPTVSPESIVIPIVSCIFGFPILAFIVICCLRHRAKLARERDRRRNYDMQDHAVSLVRFSPIHRLNYRSSRAISLRPERSLSQGFTSLELDTVVEERCSDVEQTQTEILHPESPMESSTSYKMSISSS